MVDENGHVYFNIFWTPDSAMGAHDWPDFGDVCTRQLQGVVMARLMTGITSKCEQMWLSQVVENINSNGGLLYRPKTNYSKNEADIGDQALTLYALTTVYAENRDEKLLVTIKNMIDALDMRFI